MSQGRAMLWGAAAGVLAVVLAAAGLIAYGGQRHSSIDQPGDRVMIVLAGRDVTDGGYVAQMVAVADMRGSDLRVGLVDTMSTVTVPGTDFERLRDAYPFGGGEGVSRAYAAVAGGKPLPVIALGPDAVVRLVDRLGGVTVTVPVDVNVFDGKRLYSFDAGPRHLDGEEAASLLSAADYLSDEGDRKALSCDLASSLMSAAARAGGRSMEDTAVASSMDPQGLATTAERLVRLLPSSSATVTAW